MKNIESLIKSETNYMFSDMFYSKISKKINDFYVENKNKKGFVYFIKNGSSSSKVKIGCAINIDKRVASYQTAFYEKIFLVGYIESEDYVFLEKEVHSFLLTKELKESGFI